MNKLIPLEKFFQDTKNFSFVSNTSVVVDNREMPVGFVFGRDAFITFLEHIDGEFENKITDQKKAFNNPAGKLIDLIEENLQVQPRFIQELKDTISYTKKQDWIPLDEVVQSLHV